MSDRASNIVKRDTLDFNPHSKETLDNTGFDIITRVLQKNVPFTFHLDFHLKRGNIVEYEVASTFVMTLSCRLKPDHSRWDNNIRLRGYYNTRGERDRQDQGMKEEE